MGLYPSNSLFQGYRMILFNWKVLTKFGLCSNCLQKLHGCSLARARKIFATAGILAFSLTCARLLEISLILPCSYFLYSINDKSVMTWLKQKGCLKPSFAWTRKRDCKTIYLPGNSDVVDRKLDMTGGDIISCGDNIPCEPYQTHGVQIVLKWM